MAEEKQLEFWLRGPVPGIIPVLQPVAHALLQARMEAQQALSEFPESMLWQRPGGVASIAFHLQHLAGVVDRLFTYANGMQLSEKQLKELEKEGKEDSDIQINNLIGRFNRQIDTAIDQLKKGTYPTTRGATISNR